MDIFIDIETIPDQTVGALEKIKESLTVKAPDLTKPNLIEVLGLGDNGKYKTVPELKDLWLEEFADQAKEEQATEQWLKTSFDGAKGQICCICASVGGDTIKSFSHKDETTLLNDFNMWILENSPFDREQVKPRFIAHNKAFDLPFLYKRMVINKVKPLFKFNPHDRYYHYCTMESWAGFNGKVSLSNLCSYLGVKGKTEGMDGSQVWPEYKKGNIDKITKYCVDDVACLVDVYSRLEFL